ncbi:pyridoxal phosphate-dependent transferase [Pyronema domesticum]|nr:pyridoxal phosphate-dependent transferase [Pyronema domesticum]
MTNSTVHRALNAKNINPNILKAQYAVRGEIAVRSEEYRKALQAGAGHRLPFHSVISANIGNPQQLDQKPITFFRQVLSIMEYPALIEHEEIFPEDVRERARVLLEDVGSVGAYSQSQGAYGIRKSVANFIKERDGFEANPDDIFLTGGASAGVHTLLNTICASRNTGVLIPIPQYPLYTATLALLDATAVSYHLNEEQKWSTNVELIETARQNAADNGTDVRCICVINPGNPTGSSLSVEDIKGVIRIAAKNHLVIMADEVYQTNVYDGVEFHSFKKVLRTLQREEPGRYDHVELVSLHSTSKGIVGECGHRGGYFELVNFDPEVKAQIYKLVSITLCPPVIGQCLVELMVNPPKEGEPSWELYNKERNHIFNGLESRAKALYQAFKDMTGVSCQNPDGAMYLFPSITIPEKAQAEARSLGKQPDEFYCLKMLDATGICVVPGSGFGQVEGTWHFRTTFLPPGTEWVDRLKKFHEGFMKEYSD